MAIDGAFRNWRSINLLRAALLAPAVIFILGAYLTAPAQTAGKTKSQQQANKPSAQTESSLQQTAIDPATGKFRQLTPEEAKTLAEGMKKLSPRNPDELNTIYMTDGSVMIELSDEYMDFAVVERNADGTLSFGCVTGAKNASAAAESAAKRTENRAKADAAKTDKTQAELKPKKSSAELEEK